MSINMPGGDEAQQRRARVESRREREFYEYYDALEHLSNTAPVYCDLADPEALKRHVPVGSPDKALSAFCQLGALQMRANRALLFFFNQTHAFILAEATPTLSLQDKSRHKEELWMGYAKVDRTHSVCEYTINLPPTRPDGNVAASTIPLNIIPDLRETQQFCNYPYVANAPNIRFYAGVPITTARGINIGAFCVLDNVVRGGLTEQEMKFMREMSVTVVQHLEGLRAKADRERGSQMVECLNSFIQGSSDSRTRRHKANGGRGRPVRKMRSPLITQQAPLSDIKPNGEQIAPSRRSSARAGKPHNSSKQLPHPAAKSDSNGALSDGLEEAQSLRRSSTMSAMAAIEHLPGQRTSGSYGDELHAAAISSALSSTFQRASVLLQQAIAVDEVLFLDASITSFGSFAKDLTNSSEPPTDSGTSGGDSEDQQDSVCRILSQCHVPSETTPSEQYSASNGVSEGFLKSLLKRYPNGNIWNFFTNDESSSDATSTTYKPKSRNSSRQGETAELQRVFPDCQSLALYGLWDHKRKRWYAACFLWTSSPIRLFSNESEMNFVAAFCDVITAEIHRREMERSDRAKADFISSISHELRSPLHGILGSAEVLQDQRLDDFSTSMVHQIDVSGRTLLEIIDNLLDFSKINYSAKHGSRNLRKDVLKGLKAPITKSSHSDMRGLISLDADTPLDQITEESVHTSVSAYLYNRKFHSARSVTTVLDIEQPGAESWKCRLDGGSWKRVTMNLITNALKCTDNGHIYVGLRTESSGQPNGRLNAVLEVQDTGKGMSQQFVREELFAAFSQEDSFLEGTGLGMHIVARIVKTFGGKINVQTDQTGGGTCITVVVPLETSQPQYKTEASQMTLEPFSGLTAGIINLDTLDITTADYKARQLHLSTVTKCCNQQGIKTAIIDNQDLTRTTNLNIIAEQDLLLCLQRWEGNKDRTLRDTMTAKPLVVLCECIISERELRLRVDIVFSDQPVGYVVQPCGPRQLHAAIRSILEKQESMQASNSLRAESQAGLGAMDDPWNGARLSMPIRAHSTGESSQHSAGGKKFSPTFGNPKPTTVPADDPKFPIMVVEDNHINLQLLVTYARKQGLPCITAENGKQAFEAYKLAHEDSKRPSPSPMPRVVLMDINMPVLNGFEATQAIRTYEIEHSIKPAKILALTGLGSAEAQREAYTSGCDMFLSKPVRLKELTKILEDFKTNAG